MIPTAIWKRSGVESDPVPITNQLFAYGSSRSLDIVGQFQAVLCAGEKSLDTTIIVAKKASSCLLLSEMSLRKLGIIQYNEKFLVQQVDEKRDLAEVAQKVRPNVREIVESHSDMFSTNIGKAVGKQVTIMMDQAVTPVVQKPRRVPYNLAAKAEEKIAYLLNKDIIENVPDDEVRSWDSPKVIAPKPNTDQIRLCVDMRMANKAILRPYTQLPTLEDMINKFQGAKKFSKLDLREAYHQFKLTTESRKITTFYGPDGLYRYKRLNYGTQSAQDILQNEMRSILAGIPNQINIADDILIAGSVKEHNQALELVLARLQANGMTVNAGKCQFDVEEISFVGLTFNKKGIQPDPTKVEALHLAGPPKSKEELRSLLGMAGFSERFIPNYANTTAPLQELLKADTWDWNDKHQHAFEELQQALQEDTLLQPYEIGRETRLVVDASLGGLGAVLLQKRSAVEGFRPVVFKSRSLSPSESNYSTTEREAHAIRWGSTTVQSDYRP